MEGASKMKHNNTAIETINRFCSEWFEQRDAVGAVSFLTEDINFVGTSSNEHAQGKSSIAHKGMLTAGKILAASIWELLLSPEIMEHAQKDFLTEKVKRDIA